MKKTFPLILLAASYLSSVMPTPACAEKYFFRNYKVEDGLESNCVNAVLQDRQGFLWFATTNGICKFDGITFTTYTTRNGLPSNDVLRIYEDSRANLWFSFRKMGVGKFDGQTWTYYHDYFPPNPTVGAIYEDSRGGMWFGTYGDGVVRFDGEKWISYSQSELGDSRARVIFEDSRGIIWIGMQDKGICVFDGNSWQNIRLPEFGYETHINSIVEDHGGNIWLAGYGGWDQDNILIKLPGYGRIDEYEIMNTRDGVPTGDDPILLLDSQERLWLASDGGGLNVFNGRSWIRYNTANGLPSSRVISLIEDSESNIWIGTAGNGVARFSGEEFVTFTVDDGLPGNSIVPVLADSRGNLWFNSRYVEGVTKYDGSKWTTLTAGDGGGCAQVLDVFEDSRKRIWFSTGNSLIKLDGGVCTTYSQNYWVGGIKFEDSKGYFWLDYPIMFDGREFVVISDTEQPESKLYHFFTYTTDAGVLICGTDAGLRVTNGYEERFLNEQMAFKVAMRDMEGNTWFGTDSGLICTGIDDFFKYSESNSRIPGSYYSTENGLAHNDILALHQAGNGDMWIGTNGGGVSRLSDGKFASFTVEDGLCSNVCFNIFGSGNWLYFNVSKGINRFNGERFSTFSSENDGFTVAADALPLQDKKGAFWFNSPGGVIRFKPDTVNSVLVSPPVYITRFRISDQDTVLTSGLRLKATDNNLRIDYVGISMSAPEDVVYSYRLAGLDTAWTNTRDHWVTYPYLPPGDYEFTVRARARNGVWSERPARLQFEILPPYWATLWFKGLMLAVVLAFGLGVHFFRTRFIRKRNLELRVEIGERRKAEAALRERNLEVVRLKDRLEAENIYLQEEIKLSHSFKEIIGDSKALNMVLEKVEKVGHTDATVLILGETGTGKQLIARAIHILSPRAERPMMTINCATLSRDLMESELFGHEKGSFTGAHSRKIGRFEVADGGTLFLDEIGELPLELQAKLLRVLQDGEFERLGSTSTIRVDVRIIAATNRDLEREIARGSFREDLFYRLNVYPIRCPSLRERKEDIPLLVNHFVNVWTARTGKRIESVPQNVMDTLMAYDWPGNIRELENVIERAVIVSSGNQLKLSELLTNSGNGGNSTLVSLEAFEKKQKVQKKEYIEKVMALTGWKVRGKPGAADILGVKPTTLESKMTALGIKRSEK